jgi:hypothetical protein
MDSGQHKQDRGRTCHVATAAVSKGLVVYDNRVPCLPPGLLKDFLELHTISVRSNPVTMQQLRETHGFEAFSQRQSGKLDKAINAHIAADFPEAAAYEQFHRH